MISSGHPQVRAEVLRSLRGDPRFAVRATCPNLMAVQVGVAVVSLPPADAVYDRIDLVCLDVDTMEPTVLPGTPAAQPLASVVCSPLLPLARIHVRRCMTAIFDSAIEPFEIGGNA